MSMYVSSSSLKVAVLPAQQYTSGHLGLVRRYKPTLAWRRHTFDCERIGVRRAEVCLCGLGIECGVFDVESYRVQAEVSESMLVTDGITGGHHEHVSSVYWSSSSCWQSNREAFCGYIKQRTLGDLRGNELVGGGLVHNFKTRELYGVAPYMQSCSWSGLCPSLRTPHFCQCHQGSMRKRHHHSWQLQHYLHMLPQYLQR